MKKRILTCLMAVSLLVSLLAVPVGAASVTKFSDVSDSYTATAIETLRLMGVLDGYGDGTFRPDTVLNRAQFCKMAVYAMDGSGELGRYSTVTIFPDVKPSHWASAYINMASRKGIISGFADGKFKPGQTVTAGQAVTILMRGLGYKDEDMGGVWPQSYMAEAQTNGLLKSTGITSAYAGVTRAQAAKLFMNLFEAKHGKGDVLFSYSVGKDEVYLTAVDGGKGTMTAGGTEYDMAHPVTSTSLIGSKGKVVTNSEGEILTFLPVTGSGGVSNAAVIIGNGNAGSTLGALAGSSSYNVYKNGTPASVGDLKRYDVATYSAATNSIIVSDTRVSVYYEDCSPSPSNPSTITVLNGMKLNVLPTAVDSLSKLKPGKQIVLLLTADGQVAGAEDANSGNVQGNAMAYVDGSGSVQMICGGSLLTVGTASDYAGQVVSLSSSKSGSQNVKLNLGKISGGAGGELNVPGRTLGGRKLTDNAFIFDGGKQIGLGELGQSVINESRVTYARTNWAGQVDLVVLNGSVTGDTVYGRAKVVTDRDDTTGKETQSISIETKQKTYGPIKSGNNVSSGAWVAVRFNKGETGFTSFATMTRLGNVPASAWVGKTAVTYGSRTYEVPSNVQCYNADTDTWMTDLDAARDYGGTMNLYVYDGIVRAVEVKG